jgi:virginiamycin B lyase
VDHVVESELQTVAPKRRWRSAAFGAAGLIVLAAVAVPALVGNSPTTKVANRDAGATAPTLDDSGSVALEPGEPAIVGEATTTVLPRTNTTVTPTTRHIDPVPLFDPDDGVPESPPVIPDQLIELFPLATKGSWPYDIAAGPGNDLWFVENGTARIGRITAAGVITEYPLATHAGPAHITKGPDGAMWFTVVSGAYIGRITADGTITEYPVGSMAADRTITTGPDGAIWFTLRATPEGGFVVRMTTSGQITKFKTPHDFADSIAVGPDGNLWATDQAGFINRVSPSGVLTEYAVPFGDGYVGDITAGPDGAMWFGWSGITHPSASLGRITMSGEMTRIALPTDGDPAYVVTGPDGNLWVTMNNVDKVVRVTPAGEPTLFAVQRPMGISVGPDGNIWFTSTEGNAVGRLSLTAIGDA